jgi:hypothetical protein
LFTSTASIIAQDMAKDNILVVQVRAGANVMKNWLPIHIAPFVRHAHYPRTQPGEQLQYHVLHHQHPQRWSRFQGYQWIPVEGSLRPSGGGQSSITMNI